MIVSQKWNTWKIVSMVKRFLFSKQTKKKEIEVIVILLDSRNTAEVFSCTDADQNMR